MSNTWNSFLANQRRYTHYRHTLSEFHHFSTIAILGTQAASFLQGQLTCDVLQLTNNNGCLFACCDHKGRMQFNGWLLHINHEFYFYLPHSMTEIACSHLSKYAAFSRVELKIMEPEWVVLDASSDQPLTEKNIITLSQPPCQPLWHECGKSRQLLIGHPDNMISAVEKWQSTHSWIDTNHWSLLNIQSQLVYLQPETHDAFIPQMITWDQVGGIDFNKGCYVGQEIIARTQHLGKLKRHLQCAVISNTTNPIDLIGKTIINTQHVPVGQICNAVRLNQTKTALNAVIQDQALDGILLTEAGISVELI